MLTLWRNAHVASCDEAARVYAFGVVLTEGDRVVWVGAERELPAGARPARTVELGGRWLTPGLIDCHTHLVFAGQRASEFAPRDAATPTSRAPVAASCPPCAPLAPRARRNFSRPRGRGSPRSAPRV
jgi:imidazolonepropionase-like amidohydrolase